MKENITNIINFLNKRKKLTTILLGGIIILFVGLVLIIPKVQASIRSSEIQSLVQSEKLNKKANYLDPKTADELISKKPAMTVLFSVPHGTAYEEIQAILKDDNKMSEFTHSIYLYPMVYNINEIEKKYGVKENEVTIVFFESGKEKNKYQLNSDSDINASLISTLNQMPMSTMIEPTVPQVQPSAATTTQNSNNQNATSSQSSVAERTNSSDYSAE
ncbi:hypothetical protein GIX45_10265 [Erwinia sp. CPCC 100877]|nr:hypothetical protein [Erwinia sp. CPCC 100877]